MNEIYMVELLENHLIFIKKLIGIGKCSNSLFSDFKNHMTNDKHFKNVDVRFNFEINMYIFYFKICDHHDIYIIYIY
jgi:hypothetical protein